MLACVPATAAARPAAPVPGTTLVITVRSILTSSTPRDKPPTGPSKGDRIEVRDNLLNVSRQFGKKAGAVVGTDSGVMTMTSKTAARVVGYATLPGGKIRFHGVLNFQGAYPPFTVDGGTGRYARARGFLIVGEGSNPINVYHLKLPSSNGTTV